LMLLSRCIRTERDGLWWSIAIVDSRTNAFRTDF
jgi:hypothetical protein